MVLELPELARENQNWKIYHAHILNSAAAEGVVSHLSGAAPKPVDSRELEAWNSSNAVAKYIILEVITDSLLARLMHHELAHTLYSHLAAIFGDNEPIAIELPAECSDEDEPLREDSHQSDGADSARTATIVKGKDVERAGAAAENPMKPPQAPDGLSSADRSQETEPCGRERIAHDTDRETGHSGLPSELKTTEIHDEKPSGTMPTGIPIIPSTPSTNNTVIYLKDPGEPPNAPDGTSRGDVQETAENGGQWQRTMHEVNRNDETASPAPNLADRMSEVTTGDGPISLSRTRPIKTVKHQHKSTRNIPLPIGRANANAQHSKGHLKPKIYLPRRQRPPLKGERDSVAANGYTRSSSGQSMPQKLATTSNESETLTIVSIESEDSGSGEMIAHIRLGGTSPRADDANGPGRRTEMSKGQADVSRAQMDALNASNNAERGGISNGDEPTTYLGAGDAKRGVDATGGLGGHADASNGHTDAHSVGTDARKPENARENVRNTRNELKRPDSPSGDAKRDVDETDGLGGHADRSNGQTDASCVQMDAITTANATQNVSTGPTEPKPPDSPLETAKQHSDEPNGCRSHADGSSACTHAYCVGNDTQTAANAPETVSIPRNESKLPNSPAEAAMQRSNEPDGCRDCADRSSVHTDTQNVQTDVIILADESKRVRTPPNDSKTPNLPNEAARQRSDEPNACGSPTDASSVRTDTYSIAAKTEMAENASECVRTPPSNSKMQDSPHGRENEMPKYIYRWKRVSIGDGDTYVPWNAPIDRTSRKFVLGRVEGGDEAIAPSVEGERAGDWVGNRDERNGDADGTTSGGSIDSKRVKTALLAVNSQHTRYRSRARGNGSPVPSWTSTNHAKRPYGPARRQRRRGKLKIERINDKSVSQTPEVETTHLQRAHATRAPEIPSKHFHRVHTPIRRHGIPMIEWINISPTRNGETAYLRRDPIAQPRGDDPQRSYRVPRPRRRRGRLKPRPTNVSRTPEDEKTYQGPYKPIHLLPRDAGDPLRSTPIGYLLYSLQCLKSVLQKVSRDDNKSIASSTHPSANTSISARRDLPNRVTTPQSYKPSQQKASDTRATDYIRLESLSTHSFDI